MASTTKIFVNDVIIRSSAGATDSSVMPIRVTTELDGAALVPPMFTETPPAPAPAAGVEGAVGAVGSACAAAIGPSSSQKPTITATAIPAISSHRQRAPVAASAARTAVTSPL